MSNKTQGKCEICKKKRFLSEHHIQSRCYGGTNKSNNLAYICENCHKLVHMGLIIIEGRFDAIDGNLVIWRKLGEEKVIEEKEDPEVYIIPNTEHIRETYLKEGKSNEYRK